MRQCAGLLLQVGAAVLADLLPIEPLRLGSEG